MNQGVYRHYRGRYYLVIGIAIHSETREQMVVYMPLYDTQEGYIVRPRAMFEEDVIVSEGIARRFTYVGQGR